MRRTLVVVSLLAVAALAAGLVLVPAFSPAQPGQPGPGGEQPTPAAVRPSSPLLPVAKVVLFTSGVGYFERRGEVEGGARIDLTFPVNDINDLLKSMVLQDLDKGRITAVGCDSQDPVEKTLHTFAIDLSGNPSFGEVLNQARGEKIEVILQQSAATQPGKLAGTVMGVERQRQPGGKEAFVEVEVLNLWCADGLRSLKLADLQRVKFLDPVLDSEVQRALEVLAQGHDTRKKTVSLHCTGEGKRRVRVGYVIENPIWKTTYRLVLDGQKKPFLQGWAMVENPSDDDWNDVEMRLVSGRPISFRMDLYQPLYVDRPLVELERHVNLRPPVHEGEMDRVMRMGVRMLESLPMPKDGFKEAPAKKAFPDEPPIETPPRRPAEKFDPSEGVPPVAQASKLGDFFQYAVSDRVSLPRRKSALLPIINQEVEGAKVSVYNERTQAKHPLLGLRLKNTSGLHLMQGPITVFDEGSYAGDARIEDVQPGEERLLSYAIDLGVEVKPSAKREPEQLVKVRINRGVLEQTRTLRETKTYEVANNTKEDRLVVVEHPDRSPDFSLVAPEKPDRQSRSVLRFEVEAPAGKTVSLPVVEEKQVVHKVALTNADDQAIRVLLEGPALSDKVKTALQQAVQLRGKLAATQREIGLNERQLKAITEAQARLRENMKVVPQTDPLFKEYLDQFRTQEADVRKLEAQIKKLQEAEHQQRQEYENYLTNLTIE